jgi:predicted RNA-binding protein with RPS1 domain
VLSLRRAGLERKWRAMQEQFEAGVIIEAPVIDHNKGGLIVDCGIRGFVPISQIVDFPRRPQNDQPRDAAQEIAEKLQPFVGRKLRLKILEVNRKANRLILSEKVALYEERREKRDELFSSLQVGQKVSGTVRSIAPFGVFIDLGGIDGLVHKSELSWNKVNNPEAGYKVGDEVEAEVIDINHERGRISLSIRRLQPDPWHSTVADFKVGDVIDGTVTKLVNFGAFVRVPRGPRGPHPHQRAVPPARRPPGRCRPRGPGPEAEDHLPRLRAPSPGPLAQAGRGAAGPPGARGAARRWWRGSDGRTAPGAPRSRSVLGRGLRPGARGRHRHHARGRVRAGPGAGRSAEAAAQGWRRNRAPGNDAGPAAVAEPEVEAEPETAATAEVARHRRQKPTRPAPLSGVARAEAEPRPRRERRAGGSAADAASPAARTRTARSPRRPPSGRRDGSRCPTPKPTRRTCAKPRRLTTSGR